jgi:hypothetical protein
MSGLEWLLLGSASVLAIAAVCSIRNRRIRRACDAGNHKIGTEYRKGYRYPENYRNSVADKFTQTRSACVHCGAAASEWADEGRAVELQGYTWPSERADQFRRDGILIDEQGFR